MTTRNVKNTMVNFLLDVIAPDHCYSCGVIGAVLCEYCKYDIKCEPFQQCFLCKQPISIGSSCSACRLWYDRQWAVGQKVAVLEQMIYDLKFERKRSIAEPLARMLGDTIGVLPRNTVIVPIPTISPHIRMRGYDHVKLLANYLAIDQQVPVCPLLLRKTNTRQRGAGRQKRIRQAEQAFGVASSLDPSKTYLILDDVSTTGATLQAAAKKLRDHGATTIWAACITYQAPDE